MEKEISSLKVKGSCLLAAFVFITICSKSSFIYPLNDWGDAHCYFTIGRGIINGMVPYRDLFEQKGVFIFFIYAIAALISSTSFIGVYFIEIICAAVYLYYTLKTAALFMDISKYRLGLTFFLAACVYSSASFCHGGSVEEIFTPIFVYGVYLCVRQFEKHIIPNAKEMIAFGIGSAVIFYTKYTLCIFIISLILFMLIEAKKSNYLSLLLRQAIFFVIPCIIVTVIVMIYFLCNGALGDFYQHYVYDNLFRYSPDKTAYSTNEKIGLALKAIGIFFRKRNVISIFIIFAGMAWLIGKRKYLLFLCHLFSFILLFYIQFFIASPQKYYGFPLVSLSAVGLCCIVEFFENRNFSNKRVINVASIAISIIIAIVFTDNRYFMFKDKSETPQYIFAEKMESYNYDDYHLLYYGALDEGYYFASGTLPNCRAFNQNNLLVDNYRIDIQNEYIKDKKVEFIVTKSILCDTKDYDACVEKYGSESSDYIVTFDDFGYELVAEKENYYEQNIYLNKLYKIID